MGRGRRGGIIRGLGVEGEGRRGGGALHCIATNENKKQEKPEGKKITSTNYHPSYLFSSEEYISYHTLLIRHLIINK